MAASISPFLSANRRRRLEREDRSRRARALPPPPPPSRRDDGPEMGQSRRAWGIRAHAKNIYCIHVYVYVYMYTLYRDKRPAWRPAIISTYSPARFKVVGDADPARRRARAERSVVSASVRAGYHGNRRAHGALFDPVQHARNPFIHIPDFWAKHPCARVETIFCRSKLSNSQPSHPYHLSHTVSYRPHFTLRRQRYKTPDFR